MIVTEEEAKTKACQERFGPPPSVSNAPPVQHFSGGAIGHFPTGYYQPYTCLGSGCMAWRWHQPARDEQWYKSNPPDDDLKDYLLAGYELDPDNVGGVRIKTAEAVTATGYCGKAGRP